MASIFEKTMQACRESRKKDLKEAKKNASKKAVTEKVDAKRIKREADEDFDDEFIGDEEEVADEVEDDTMLDIADDIVAVVDPELDADEMNDVAMNFQQIVNDTPENEIPETDEYLDQSIYGCPVCGAKFFSADDMSDGGKCPVCGEEADGFVLAGEVEASDDVPAEDEEAPAEDEEIEVDDIEEFDDEDVIEDEEEVEEESKKPVRKTVRKEMRRPMRRPVAKRTAESRKVRPVTKRSMNLDEKTFNKFLQRFANENYSNISRFAVVGARMKGNKLTLECRINFKSGNSKKVNLECKYDRRSKYMTAKDNGAFKTEATAKRAPFMFKISTVGDTIRCEGMRYNFTTRVKVKNESKRAQVYGSYLGESVRKPVRASRRSMMRNESIASVARRNDSRRNRR